MLKYLLSALMSSGIGERDSENQTSDFRNLTNAYKDARETKRGGAQLSRLQDAFSQLKDMHKDNAATTPAPFDFETAKWPFGPVGAPSQSMAHSAAPPVSASVPMPMARPAEAPQAPPAQSPFAEFFGRNTAMMKDPSSGDFIDPSAAAKAGPGILNGLFG